MMTQVFLAIVETFGMFAIGALVMHLKILDDKDLGKLSTLIVDIFFPMLAFDSIVRNFDPSQLKELWLMPTIGFGLMVFGGVLGFGLRYGMRNRTHDRMVTFHHFCAINNYLFLPLIILSNLSGEKYLALLFIMNIGSTIGFWTLGVGILAGGDVRRTFNNIFSINQAAVVLALIICFCKIPVPAVVMPLLVIVGNIFHKLGNCSVPLILLLIGLDMLQAKRSPTQEAAGDSEEAAQKEDAGIVPLGIPMLAGPGAISSVMVLVGQVPRLWHWEMGAILGSIGITALVSYWVLAGAGRIRKVMGETGIRILVRIMGLLLVALAMQFFVNGLTDLGLIARQ